MWQRSTSPSSDGHPTNEEVFARYGEFDPETMDQMTEEVLRAIADTCKSNDMHADCIGCRAYATLLDDSPEVAPEYDGQVERPLEPLPVAETPDDAPAVQEEGESLQPFQIPTVTTVPESVPVVERFARQVEALSGLVEEMVAGPPIPPPNVTLAELASLVVGAQKWVKMIDAQDLELSDGQQRIKAEIERVLAKVQPGRGVTA